MISLIISILSILFIISFIYGLYLLFSIIKEAHKVRTIKKHIKSIESFNNFYKSTLTELSNIFAKYGVYFNEEELNKIMKKLENKNDMEAYEIIMNHIPEGIPDSITYLDELKKQLDVLLKKFITNEDISKILFNNILQSLDSYQNDKTVAFEDVVRFEYYEQLHLNRDMNNIPSYLFRFNYEQYMIYLITDELFLIKSINSRKIYSCLKKIVKYAKSLGYINDLLSSELLKKFKIDEKIIT